MNKKEGYVGALNMEIRGYGFSLNALARSYAHNTIRTEGCCQGRNLIVLIDNGSTHNFINMKVVEKIKITRVKTIVFVVTIANGSMIRCESHCLKFDLVHAKLMSFKFT